jgi:hypothetical protein
VLNSVDDHGYTNIVDFGYNPPLTPAQILAGGIQIPDTGSFSGKCGAYIIATYKPLIMLDGSLSGGIDPFDVVNPVWESTEVATQTGRSLFLWSPSIVQAATDHPNWLDGVISIANPALGVLSQLAKIAKNSGVGNVNVGNAGLSDTFAAPEIIYHFSIKRLMVPFLPQMTIAAYNKTINQINNATLGNLTFPKWTLRFDRAENQLGRAPDGTTYYDLTLHFSVRRLWEDIYDDLPDGTTWDGAGSPALKSIKGWVTWNHAYGIPADRITGLQVGSAGYYSVCWNGGAFQLFGNNRTLYLGDGQKLAAPPPTYAGTFTGAMLADLFTSGFRLNQ